MFHRNWLSISLAILMVPLHIQAGYGITLRFHSKVAVSKPFIHLGDIAEITGASPEILLAYKNATLAPSPPVGTQRILDFDTIRNRMLALGLTTGELEFTGPSRILVENMSNKGPNEQSIQKATSQEVSKVSLETLQAERIVLQAIRDALASTLNPSELAQAEIQVQILSHSVFSFLETNPADWNITGWSPELDQPHQLLLTKKQETQRPVSVPVTCSIKMPPRVLTVKQALPVGHIVTDSDLDWVYSSTTDAGIPLEEIIGMETQRSLRPGVPIRSDDLRKKPFVRSRDLVSVSARQGGIVVKRTMRALGTGGLGESVTFVTLDGKERIAARIIGFHEAEVMDSDLAPIR